MAAHASVSAEYEILFKSKGLNSIEKDLSNFTNKVQGLQKNIAKYKLPDLKPRLSHLEAEMLSIAEKSSKLVDDLMKTEDISATELSKFQSAFRNITGKWANIRSEIIAIEQAIKHTAAGTTDAIQKNTKALQEYGYKTTPALKEANAALGDLQKLLAEPGGVDKLRAVNKQLEREI